MEIERVGDITVMAFEGELDAVNLPTMNSQVDDLIGTGERRFVFNFHNVNLINSSTLGFLIKTRKRLEEMHGALVLSEPAKVVHSAISTLGIDQVFDTFPSNAAAADYLRDHGGDESSGVTAPLQPDDPSG